MNQCTNELICNTVEIVVCLNRPWLFQPVSVQPMLPSTQVTYHYLTLLNLQLPVSCIYWWLMQETRYFIANAMSYVFLALTHWYGPPTWSTLCIQHVTASNGVRLSAVLIIKSDIFSCDQAALWMVFSVRLSVCLSVRLSITPFWLCSHHRIIMKFSGVITTDQGNVHAKGQGQRSKVKVTEVTTQIFISGL